MHSLTDTKASTKPLQFASSKNFDVPTNIAEYRKIKNQRGHDAQEFLKQPGFVLLKDKVAVENTETELPEVPGHKFPIRIYRPAKSVDGKLPVMIYFHGGYWCSGTANAEDLGCRAVIARGTDIIIVSFEYRLIPEVDWKTVFSDAENAVKWMAANADRLGGDVSKGFLVGGAEAGAHLAAISAIRTRDRQPSIKLTGQNLIVCLASTSVRLELFHSQRIGSDHDRMARLKHLEGLDRSSPIAQRECRGTDPGRENV